jgi:Protein of unknown function (DUF3710)
MALGRGRRGRRSERAKLDATPPWDEREREEAEPTTGPWDEADLPADDSLERLDLGALRIAVVSGVEVRVDVGPDGQVGAATLSQGNSELQVGVFAAPRTAGIWDAVRKEIRGSIASQGGTATDERGTFGMELTARVPAQGGYQTVRFVGVDGPRWFLRGMFTGAGATDRTRSAALEEAFGQIVVIRGPDPMPVRDPLPLRLPRDVAEQAAKETGIAGLAPSAGADADAVTPAERDGVARKPASRRPDRRRR